VQKAGRDWGSCGSDTCDLGACLPKQYLRGCKWRDGCCSRCAGRPVCSAAVLLYARSCVAVLLWGFWLVLRMACRAAFRTGHVPLLHLLLLLLLQMVLLQLLLLLCRGPRPHGPHPPWSCCTKLPLFCRLLWVCCRSVQSCGVAYMQVQTTMYFAEFVETPTLTAVTKYCRGVAIVEAGQNSDNHGAQHRASSGALHGSHRKRARQATRGVPGDAGARMAHRTIMGHVCRCGGVQGGLRAGDGSMQVLGARCWLLGVGCR
jgi:hypothetical protein